MSQPSVPTQFDVPAMQAALRDAGMRATLHWQAEVDSTNAWAMGEAERGAAPFSWYVADSQTAGRGRLGRAWVSPPGRNLYASVVLRPSLPVAAAAQTGLAAALAVQRAVSACGLEARIKWPNDVHVNGRKISGILSEVHAEPDNLKAIVVGIGINVAMTAAEFPPEIAAIATSIHAAGGTGDRARVFLALATHLESLVATLESDGFAALRTEWNRHSLLQGRPVEILFGGETRQGVVEGLDDEGFLLLQTPTGLEKIVAGDVTVKK
jgi:BirA family biotin operon repressor/biotin-[acetyl-CoA-carboxylase] ligase